MSHQIKLNCFHVCNGVKQGGVILPILFNVYMDGLSINLNNSSIGGYIGGQKLNHICYADDYLSNQSNNNNNAYLYSALFTLCSNALL